MSEWTVVRADAVAALRRMPTCSCHLVVTDPAYESMEKHRKGGTTNRLMKSKKSSNEWFPVFPNLRFTALMEQLYRVLKPNCHCYVFCDDETSDVLKPIARRCGFDVRKRLVWDKTYIGMGYHYRAMYEFILFMEKGKRPLASKSVGDILRAKPVRGGYPTEKPESICATLIEQSTDSGNIVLDPFCGSGTVGAAARGLGRRFLGVDIQKSAVKLARSRLSRIEG